MSEIKIEGVDNLVAKLTELGALRVAATYLLAAGEYLKGKFAITPPKSSLTRTDVYGQPFASDKQRRKVFALIHEGEIPYRRGSSSKSEKLEQSWTVKPSSDLMTVKVGNDASYGDYVQGENQSLFMQSVGWMPVDATVNAENPHVTELVKEGLEKEIAAVEAEK